ncbi:alpha/beta hydrolase [Reichenbachiella agarivorans]|uniref:Alpha/beta hydrolase n=1 Tax=Reichenbachiella agarivorans TaxID=2979464 RepID=A0ABY6CKY2_9BACT|nr:alpha/beta hydrolase [Reichenbachiella agarivorans]UXP31181.1 alpha/beta hydrolase [Reichenbachiella agarivorans]
MATSIYHHSSKSQLEYSVFGRGKKTLVCYHGFGQKPDDFQFLEDHLIDYRIIVIRLFYHGRSKRRNNEISHIRIPEWKIIFTDFLHSLQIERFSLLAYSMGGRFALASFLGSENKIDQVILVAPDGIIRRFWYQLATFPVVLRQVFYLLMIEPKPFFWLLDRLEKKGWMNQTMIKFARKELQSEDKRLLVYRTWVSFKHLRIPQKQLIQHVNQSASHFTFIFGEKDKMIDPVPHQHFLSQLKKSDIHITTYGHNKLVENTINIIAATLNK